MTAEPTHDPGADQPPAPNGRAPNPAAADAPTAPASSDPQPTYQTAASEAAAVAAKAVAEQVAAVAAARAAAAEEAAAREAERAAREEEEAARAAELAAMTAAQADASAVDPGMSAGSEAMAMGAADAAPSMAAADAAPSMAPDASVDASMAPAEQASGAGNPAVPWAPEAVAPTAPEAAPADATPKPSRRPVFLAWTRRLAMFVASVALLAGGVMLGETMFQRTRAVPVEGGAIEFSQAPAEVAKEFISALAAGDSDAIRSSLSAQPSKDLTDEFSRFSIKKVNGVETLGTSVDGQRSATEVLLHTTNTDGNTFDINLIILVNGNTIEGFR